MQIKVIAPPDEEILTPDDIREAGRIDTVEEDTYIARLITDARIECENFTGLALLTRTLELILTEFPAVIRLPYSPVQSITSIVYIDTDGVSQTWSSSEYQTDLDSKPEMIKPAYGYSWPSIRSSDFAAVRVRYVTGYASPQVCPGNAKEWVIRRVLMRYENRDSVAFGQDMARVPTFAQGIQRQFTDALLDPIGVYWVWE